MPESLRENALCSRCKRSSFFAQIPIAIYSNARREAVADPIEVAIATRISLSMSAKPCHGQFADKAPRAAHPLLEVAISLYSDHLEVEVPG